MIFVRRLNKKVLAINPDLIETVEETPDTVIMLTNGNKYVVADTAEEIINRIVEFRKRCYPEYKGDKNG
ncbi:flagellar FlbD family protein [Syntrophobotulus glycolicus DSM 8271]|uniref:Flagellar FlbD family protein n=1 Tax=Syntrophobotulus glycolicus (strain DSM 8271 / FlGlyR) TaxID=645991 RepID=F0SZF8_SYNGF|nr:flagellar FlbD family protein [Syntrophobotulus glycolicus]ADY54963.1 flagellar FlbD family protein [Syntrophobotulus glycolicus DSM 8271]